MKKIVSAIICLALSLTFIVPCFAASDFTLRNGILFGDTIDDILAKEKTLKRASDDSYRFEGKIAGYTDTGCIFSFDDDGKLVSMRYDFSDSCYSKESTSDVYDKLYQSLVRQYGKAKGNRNGTTYIITGPAIDTMAVWVYFLGALGDNKGDYYDYDEWVIDAKDYHVKIDLVSYYYRNSDFEYQYFCDLSYLMFTDADLDAAIDEKMEKQNEVDQDL